jgi:hypothetical protein
MLEDMIKLIKEFRSPTNKAILIDMPYLRFPEHQTIFIMEPEHLHYIEEQIKVIEEQVPDKVLSEIELERIKRIYTVAQSSQDEWQLNNNRKDFILFVNEHDKRRNTNFVQTFPEYKDLYEKWSKL